MILKGVRREEREERKLVRNQRKRKKAILKKPISYSKERKAKRVKDIKLEGLSLRVEYNIS
jgi:hypothetical protein